MSTIYDYLYLYVYVYPKTSYFYGKWTIYLMIFTVRYLSEEKCLVDGSATITKWQNVRLQNLTMKIVSPLFWTLKKNPSILTKYAIQAFENRILRHNTTFLLLLGLPIYVRAQFLGYR
jgi:hypothetical protein